MAKRKLQPLSVNDDVSFFSQKSSEKVQKYSRTIQSDVVSRFSTKDKENIPPDRVQDSYSKRRKVDLLHYDKLSILDLPHPSKLRDRKHVTKKSTRKKYSIVESYLQQLRRKQTEFQWRDVNQDFVQVNGEQEGCVVSNLPDSHDNAHVVPLSTTTNSNRRSTETQVNTHGLNAAIRKYAPVSLIRSNEVTRSNLDIRSGSFKELTTYQLISRASTNSSHFGQHASNNVYHDLQCVPSSSIPQAILKSAEVTRLSVNVATEKGSDQQGIRSSPGNEQHHNISVRERTLEAYQQNGGVDLPPDLARLQSLVTSFREDENATSFRLGHQSFCNKRLDGTGLTLYPEE